MDLIPTPECGLHYDVPFDTYKRWDAVNVSVLSWAEVSAKHLKAALDGQIEDEDTKDRRFGRATHVRLLEPQQFEWRIPIAGSCAAVLKSGKRKGSACGNESRYKCGDDWFCGVNGHAPDDAEEPRDYVTHDELERINAIARSVKSHPIVNILRKHGGSEVSWVCEIEGVLMK